MGKFNVWNFKGEERKCAEVWGEVKVGIEIFGEFHVKACCNAL